MPADQYQIFAAEHGLKPDEYAVLVRGLNRTPTLTEIAMTGAMWSEHCSYKSTKVWLKQLPTKAPWVICGPGEGAGVIDIGDGDAAVFKMESHNHPSFIEPYQGAATGVGGILRDVFTMGARPIANLNALRFGDPAHPRTRQIVAGVVAGIGGYGNCVGVPTVAGETNFHASYNGNCLVNAMCVGLARADNIFTSQGAKLGQPVVYVGSKTGRDGIKGASMSSAEFDDKAMQQRPTVQVGDPFVEKLLIEACLELMATDAIVAVQDMGAAGLTCSAVEMASKAGLGIELNLDDVPQRESGMTAYEMMLSESQERMLVVLKPGREKLAEDIFKKWALDCAIIGHITDTRHIVVTHKGQVAADLPVPLLVDDAPQYQRPYDIPQPPAPLDSGKFPPPAGMIVGDVLKKLLECPDGCSRRWIAEQYDSLVGSDTAQGFGAEAGVVRVRGTQKALAMTVDCTPRYCAADPVMGGKQAVAETYRNLCAVGATPLAITDNMNFGNPEKPHIMGQFAGAVLGIREACLVLDYPVVSGNCSLYNETKGQPILPAPAIGGVGMIPDVAKTVPNQFSEGQQIFLVGINAGEIGQSLYLREIFGREEGAPPPVDLAAEKTHGTFVRDAIRAGIITACHDVSDGGLLVALAEMAMRGGCGATLSYAPPTPQHWFAEDQACYVVTTTQPKALSEHANAANVPLTHLGRTGGPTLNVGAEQLSVDTLRLFHEAWLPNFMEPQG